MNFQVKKFLRRIRMTQYELAERMGCNQSLVAMWSTGRSFPSFEKLGTLIDMGMTAEELFGKELAEKLMANSGSPATPPASFDTPEFKKGVMWVLKELEKEKAASKSTDT